MTAILDDDYLALAANLIRDAADDLRADNNTAERKELRERLQVLESWKVCSSVAEAVAINDLIWIYRDALGP